MSAGKILLFKPPCPKLDSMTQPLALVLYERLLPGSQLVNRLQDLGYRVVTVSDSARLVEFAQEHKPMLVFADLEAVQNDVRGAVRLLRGSAGTSHLPVIGFGLEDKPDLQKQAQDAGVTLIVGETALLSHLPQLLEQALQVD